MENTIQNSQHATGWIIGQILVARQTPAVDGSALALKILEEDPWVRGYAVGAYQAVIQGTVGHLDDAELYLAVTVCFAGLLGALYDPAMELNDIVQEFEHLIGPNQLQKMQSDKNYISGMIHGGQEVLTYMRKLANDTANMPADAPSQLFVHLAQDQCMVIDGKRVPSLPASLAILNIYFEHIKPTSKRRAKHHDVSKRTDSGTGCVTTIFIAATAILFIRLFL